MAPSKRRRPSLDDGGPEVINVEYAQSNLRKDSRKKARLSEDRQSDEDSDYATDEELENLQATQFREKELRKNRRPNQAAENGIIESVTCTNFMCHPFLEVTLGPLINFIIGHNGSGKSAVLTAIMLCLGGKATSTNRAGNLKGFIKEGQETCILSVKLKNAGETAYQQEVYGDSIIVERQFSKTGTSGFKIKNSNGRVISNRKADLEDICDYFALQLDNPMSVLTQDMARQFLNNSTPQEKHKFFVKGTQLEQLNQDYQLLEDSIDNMESTFSDKLRDIAVLEDKESRAKEAQMMMERHVAMRQKIRRLAKQMAWAQVEEQEKLLQSYEIEIAKAGETIKAAEDKVEAKTEEFAGADRAYEQANEAVQAIRNETDPITSEKEQVKQTYERLKAEAKEIQTEQRRIREHLHGTESRIKKAKSDIADEYRRLEEANGGSHTRRLAELDQRKEDSSNAKSRLEEHSSGLRVLLDSKYRAQQSLEGFKAPMRAKKDAIDECERRLQNLNTDRGRQQRGYPPSMPQLIHAISQDKGFTERPLGPIGDSVRLLKPVWSSILEKSFGQMLDSFVVSSKQDQTRLSGIMQRLRCSYPIMIGNKNLFDFSNQESSPEFLTSLRALEINDDLVVRQLIITQGIEQTILIEDMKEAKQIMDQTRLRNVRQCYSINPASAGWGVRLTYGWEGALSSTYIEPYNGPPRMKTDIEFQITYQRDMLQRLKREYEDLQQENRGLQTALKECEQAIFRHQRETKVLKIEVQRAETTVEELQDALDQDAVEEGRLDVFKAGLEEAESEKTMQENSYEEAVIARDKLTDSMKTRLEELRTIDSRIAEVEVKVKKIENKALKLSNQRQTTLQEKNNTIQLLEDAKERGQYLEGGRDEKAVKVASFAEQAGRIGSRIPIDPGDTTATLEKKFQKLSADLKRYEDKLGGNQQKIAEDVLKATALHTQALNRFQEEEKLCQLLKLTLIHRRDRWKQFRRRITARARLQFGWLLSERGFRGKLSVDHKQRLLDLDVQPDDTQVSKGRKAQTLSGGEKSFSTICLLLSLWEAMGAPIRCLDEFDVFMDSVNRDVSMRMMINAAKRSAGRQFILITPQSMNNISVGTDVKIIKLSDPERGQTTISLPNR